MKKYLILFFAILTFALSISAGAKNDALYVDWAGKDANNGFSAAAAIQKPATAVGKLKNGGTVVVSGKAYIHNTQSLPETREAITFTSVYEGVDYKNAEPKKNPACAFKMASGATLTISGEVIFDDIILFQENGQNTLVVADGGRLVVRDNVIAMSNHDYFWDIVVEAGGEAVIDGGIFSTVSGDGKITVGEKAKVLEGSAAVPEIPVGSPSVVFHSYSGNDANDGLSAQAPKKSLGALTGAGALGVLRSGGTIVAVGKSYLGNSYTLPTLSAPVTFTSVYDGVDYKNAEPKENPACAFKMATGAVFTIKSDVVFDDIILFQENDQNTIKVTSGATLIVTDKAILMSNHDYHFKIELEKDTVAILSAEAIKRFTIEGEGEVIPYGAPAEAQGKTTVKLTIGQTTAYVNGVAKALDVAPVIENSRTLMPLRFIAEAMGAVVDWNAATATATLKTSDVELKITLGSTTAYVNGAAKTLDVPAASRNGRTLLPVRFIAESFGAAVDWDGATSTATLTK